MKTPMKCNHGYGHHTGMHACDPYNHAGECPLTSPVSPSEAPEESYGSQLLGIGVKPLRTARMAHNHITQAPHETYYPDCPACRAIDPYCMTDRYFQGAYSAMQADRAWEEMERGLRE